MLGVVPPGGKTSTPVTKAAVRPAEQVRVSIIIPCYRAEKFLEKAVNSVIAQTESDWELILVDDCSPDDTWTVASRLAERDPRIKAFKLPENRGKSAVMNWAAERARGEWIAVLDADDWFVPHRLQRLLDAGESAGVEMVADNLVFVDIKAGTVAGTAFPRKNDVISLDLESYLAASDPTRSFDFGMLQPLIRSDFYRENRLEYCEEARVGEDFYFLLCFFVAGGRGIVVDEPLYYYIQPFGAISREWAQSGRKRYHFEQMKATNDHFIEQLRPRLSTSQVAQLRRRGRGIDAMICYHQLRERLGAGDWLGACAQMADAPSLFWPMMLRRILERCLWEGRAVVWRLSGGRMAQAAAKAPPQ